MTTVRTERSHSRYDQRVGERWEEGTHRGSGVGPLREADRHRIVVRFDRGERGNGASWDRDVSLVGREARSIIRATLHKYGIERGLLVGADETSSRRIKEHLID